MTQCCAKDTGDSEYDRARPLHIADAGVRNQIGKSVCGYRQRAGADRDVRIFQSNDEEQQGHGTYRAAAAEKPQCEAHQTAGAERVGSAMR